jgi:hypothetical protein
MLLPGEIFGSPGGEYGYDSLLGCCALMIEAVSTSESSVSLHETSVAQPFYTRGTLNIVEESWRHTNPMLHIVVGGGGGVWLVYLPIPFCISCVAE